MGQESQFDINRSNPEYAAILTSDGGCPFADGRVYLTLDMAAAVKTSMVDPDVVLCGSQAIPVILSSRLKHRLKTHANPHRTATATVYSYALCTNYSMLLEEAKRSRPITAFGDVLRSWFGKPPVIR